MGWGKGHGDERIGGGLRQDFLPSASRISFGGPLGEVCSPKFRICPLSFPASLGTVTASLFLLCNRARISNLGQ